MKKIAIFLFLASVIISCTSKQQEVKIIKRKKVDTSFHAPIVHPNKKLTVEISGMMCELGCGSSIRKELKATAAVDQVSYDFVEDRAVNTAEITFDKNKISVDRILEIISTMNDKQFTVGKHHSENFEKETTKKEKSTQKIEHSSTKSEGHSSYQTTDSHLEIPNLIHIIYKFFIS